MSDYKLISLGGWYSHLCAKVDKQDFDNVNQYTWAGILVGNACTVAPVTTMLEGGRRFIYMSRFIMDVMDKGRDVFGNHKNHDTLDNRRCNLRLYDASQNACNRLPQGGTSKYKGVHLFKESKKWMVRIMIDGRAIYLGLFKHEIIAALAYDRAARKYHGEFAYTNFGGRL